MKRWAEYFKDILDVVKTKSPCVNRKVSALIVKDNRILCTGYNAPPRKTFDNCTSETCLRKNSKSGEDLRLSRSLHAELNAIIQASRYGISIGSSDMYVSTRPCNECTKAIINAGIKTVYYIEDYNDEQSRELQRECKVNFIQI